MKLENWYLRKRANDKIYAEGDVYGHFKCKDGTNIRPSQIVKIYVSGEGEYILKSENESYYVIKEKEMDSKLENIKSSMDILHNSELFDAKEIEQELQEAEASAQERRTLGKTMTPKLEKIAMENMDEDGLVLFVDGIVLDEAILKRGSNYRNVDFFVNVGMYSNSVLVMDDDFRLVMDDDFRLVMDDDFRKASEDSYEVDFRYYANKGIEPYVWDEDLGCVYIYNMGKKSVLFIDGNKETQCKPYEFMKFEY